MVKPHPLSAPGDDAVTSEGETDMLRKVRLTIAAACIAASTIAIAGEPSPFVGNWAGEWDHKKGKGQLNELKILAVDAKGRITALYCFERP